MHSKSFAHITELPARRCPLSAPALAECYSVTQHLFEVAIIQSRQMSLQAIW